MDLRLKLNDLNLLPLQSFEEKFIQGGDTGYYGSSPSQLLTNMDKNGRAFYNAAHYATDLARGIWDGLFG